MDQEFRVTLFHNPACGTSRRVLADIRAAGFEPEVIEYLRTGWDREELEGLVEATGAGVRALLRAKEGLATELGLLEPGVTDARLMEAMLAHPLLVERPIVATSLGVVLARPAERVREVLPGRTG